MNSSTVKSPKNQGGFSLVEVLIVILMIGVFSVIAAPSWFNFLNRQKLRIAEDQIYLALRNAQKEARYNKEILQVSIQNDGDRSG